MQGTLVLKLHPLQLKEISELMLWKLESRVMGRVVSSEVSDYFQKKYELEGVEFKFNTSVTDIEDQGKQKKVILQ